MKQKDHKALAYYLLDSVGEGCVWKKSRNRRLFLLGCVGPDYVPFTYLRGFWRSHSMRGHHARYSLEKIQKSIRRLQKKGVRRFRDCFTLGTLMHYLADSFTYPHTDAFCGDMHDHRAYEKTLHCFFAPYLQAVSEAKLPAVRVPMPLFEFLRRGREEYEQGEYNCHRDCQQIVSACTGVFQTLCAETPFS